jgi:DNA adenine methylase
MSRIPSNSPKVIFPPLLRWAGSKRRLLPFLKSFWADHHDRYLEPFAGSACLFLALKPPKAILGDLNPDLIKMYLEIKYRPESFLNELATFKPRDKDEYLRLRALTVTSLSPARSAARFVYLNRFCFNGLYRTNLEGRFNVPFGGARSGTLPEPEVVRQCSRRLRTARLVRGDFAKVLAHAKRGDLVYMDPPYAVRARRVFREYDPATFAHDDIKRLRKWMLVLDSKRIDFVVSYAESDEAQMLGRGFSCKVVPVRRNIAGFAADRTIVNEVIISNR